MKIHKQDEGAALTADELKEMTALLIKLGYTVRVRTERNGGVMCKVIYAAEGGK